MKLAPMSPAEYEFWLKRSLQLLVEGRIKANCFTQIAAEKFASAALERSLPQGMGTPNNLFFTAKDENDNTVGFAWYSITADDPGRAYLYDLIVEEQFRGLGYGRQIMRGLEEDMKKRGVNRVGLNVFGFNQKAIRLYESLGFETTNQQMEKDIPASLEQKRP